MSLNRKKIEVCNSNELITDRSNRVFEEDEIIKLISDGLKSNLIEIKENTEQNSIELRSLYLDVTCSVNNNGYNISTKSNIYYIRLENDEELERRTKNIAVQQAQLEYLAEQLGYTITKNDE